MICRNTNVWRVSSLPPCRAVDGSAAASDYTGVRHLETAPWKPAKSDNSRSGPVWLAISSRFPLDSLLSYEENPI